MTAGPQQDTRRPRRKRTGQALGSPAGASAAGRSKRRPNLLGLRPVRGALGVAGFFVLAEIFTRAHVVDPQYLPPASTVVGKMVELLGTEEFMRDVLATLWGWSLAMALAIAVAVPLGVVLGSSELTYRATSAVVELMRPIPSVALIPLAIVLWGTGTVTKVALVAYAATWPILYNTIYGIHDVDPVAVDSARAFGLKRTAIIRRVVLPSTAPIVLAGVRISASIALVVIVGIELVAGTETGIGAYILSIGSSGTNVEGVFAGAAIAGVLGVVINLVLSGIDRRFFTWAHRGEAR